MPSVAPAEQRRDRQAGDLAEQVPQGRFERPVPAGVEVDGLEDAHVAGDGQRVLADEQVLEGVEAVHRVARPDARDALVGLDPDDGGRERPARDRIPGGRERRIERQDEPLQADGGDAHEGSIAHDSQPRCALTVRWAASTVPTHSVPGRRTSSRAPSCLANDAVPTARRPSRLPEDPDQWTIASWTRFGAQRSRCSSTSSRPSRPDGSSRREFIKRATVLGLSTGAIGMVIAACSSSSSSPSAAASAGAGASAAAQRSAAPRPRASAAAGGVIRIASQKPSRSTRSRCRTSAATASPSQSFEFLCTLDKDGSDIAPGLALKWTPNSGRHRLDLRPPPGRQVA